MSVNKRVSKKPNIIIAIPAYNEEHYISNVVTKSKPYASEVIVIDDASNDLTSQMAKKAGALVVKHQVNKRYGGAISSCFRVAKERDADILIILDGDGQHNPEDIPVVLNPILNNAADLIIGSRFLNLNNKIPSYRKFGINIITFLVNIFSKLKITDSQSGFRAFGRLAQELEPFDEKCMGISIEIILKARLRSLRIKEVPISVFYHNDGSSINPIKHGLSVAITVLKLRVKYKLLNCFESYGLTNKEKIAN